MTLINKYVDDQVKADLDRLREEFKEHKSPQAVKVINLRLIVGCGCGRSYTKIQRTVPHDSDLEDQDYVYDTEEGDTYM